MERGFTGVAGLTTKLGLTAALASVIAIGACGNNDTNVTPSVAANVAVLVATNNQTGVAGTALAQPVGVLVTNSAGTPVANANVAWTVGAGAGSVAAANSTTDATGVATVVWTLGPSVGTDSLVAAIGTGVSATITAVATAGPASALRITSGDAQSVTAGSTSAPLVVRVIDQFANPIANATVTWSVVGGGALSATSSTTDATGTAQVTLTTDAAPATYQVSASTTSIAPVTFTITAM